MGKKLDRVAKISKDLVYGIGSLARKTPGAIATGVKTGYTKSLELNRAINEKMAIKIKDSRIYKENDPEVFIMNDNLISKNLQDLGGQINKYYNKNRDLNRKV